MNVKKNVKKFVIMAMVLAYNPFPSSYLRNTLQPHEEHGIVAGMKMNVPKKSSFTKTKVVVTGLVGAAVANPEKVIVVPVQAIAKGIGQLTRVALGAVGTRDDFDIRYSNTLPDDDMYTPDRIVQRTPTGSSSRYREVIEERESETRSQGLRNEERMVRFEDDGHEIKYDSKTDVALLHPHNDETDENVEEKIVVDREPGDWDGDWD